MRRWSEGNVLGGGGLNRRMGVGLWGGRWGKEAEEVSEERERL